ncbi:MAG: hypothetical protein ABSA30_14710, partial [Candidatus Aminicenantales bacterium]
MKKTACGFACLLAPTACLLALTGRPAPAADERWPGVDKTVVEKFAEEAGRPPRVPYINTDQGDLLLFLFLTAGAIGGFIAGYTFRGLFPPRKKGTVPICAQHPKRKKGTVPICAQHPKGRSGKWGLSPFSGDKET